MSKQPSLTIGAILSGNLMPQTMPKDIVTRLKKDPDRALVWKAVSAHFSTLPRNTLLPNAAGTFEERGIQKQLNSAQKGPNKARISALEARDAANAFIAGVRTTYLASQEPIKTAA